MSERVFYSYQTYIRKNMIFLFQCGNQKGIRTFISLKLMLKTLKLVRFSQMFITKLTFFAIFKRSI